MKQGLFTGSWASAPENLGTRKGGFLRVAIAGGFTEGSRSE